MAKPPPMSGKNKSIPFEHRVQHSIETFDRLGAREQQPVTPRLALPMADELLSHAHPDTLRMTTLLAQNPHRDIVSHAALVEKCFHELRARIRVEELDRKQLVRAYRKDGYLLFESPQKTRKLLVIFTTIFNNLYISHLSVHALLKDLGCHLLFLKETTLGNYQRGVPTFAADLPDIAVQIQAMARKLKAEQIYVMGFSSGGYAALQTSLRFPCQGYLGLSHETDYSPGSPLPRPWYFTDEIYAQLDRRWLVDLRVMLEDADPAVPRVLVYGGRTENDLAHAQHLAGLETIRLIRLDGATHNIIQYLLGRGRLVDAFRLLVADR